MAAKTRCRSFCPADVTAAGVGDEQGQMALFDWLVADDENDKIVDLGHAAFKGSSMLRSRSASPPKCAGAG